MKLHAYILGSLSGHRGPQPFQTRICTQKQDLNKVHGTQTHVQLKFQESLKNLLKKLHELGMRGVADIVINHRCGDQQDAQGRWNVFTSTGGPGPCVESLVLPFQPFHDSRVDRLLESNQLPFLHSFLMHTAYTAPTKKSIDRHREAKKLCWCHGLAGLGHYSRLSLL